MLAAVLAAGLVLELPSELASTAATAAGAVGLVANVVLWRQASYFTALAATNPLLHTWTLSVEEQFYLLYPLLFAVLWRRARPLLAPLLAVAALASFALEARIGASHPDLAFFLGPFRAWELLTGCLVALAPAHWRPRGLTAQGLAVVGLVLLSLPFWQLFWLPSGLPTDLACAGAALLVGAGDGGTLVARALSWRPVVFVGRISYSLYLWHWPLFAFANLCLPGGVPWELRGGLILASFALAVASWRWVEQPARNARGVWQGRVVLGLVAGGALVGLAALGVWRSGGLPERFPPAVDRIASFETYDKSDEQRRLLRLPCMAADVESRDYAPGPCLAGAPGRRSILLWGDSHAADIALPMAELAARLNVTLLQATKSTCQPSPLKRHAAACVRFNRLALVRLQRGDVAVAVISAHWGKIDDAIAAAVAARAAGASVIVVGPAPDYVAPASGLLARVMLAGGDPSGLPRTMARPASFALDAAMKARFGAMPGVAYVSLTDFLCPRKCAALADGAPIVWDYGHFTLAGARLVTDGVIATPLKAELDRISPEPAR